MSDTYAHLLDGVGRDAAARGRKLVPPGSRDQDSRAGPQRSLRQAVQQFSVFGPDPFDCRAEP